MDQPIHPLRIANFRAYWGSRLAGTIGTTAQGIIIGWQVYSIARQTMDIKQAAFLLGMIGLAQFLPLFLLTPFVGLAADSFDRRWIIRITTSLLVLIAAMLGVLTWAGMLGLPALFGAAVLVGTARAFSGPAYSALAPNLVPRDSLPTAIALSSIAWQVGTIAGPSHPPLAGSTRAVSTARTIGNATESAAIVQGSRCADKTMPIRPASQSKKISPRIAPLTGLRDVSLALVVSKTPATMTGANPKASSCKNQACAGHALGAWMKPRNHGTQSAIIRTAYSAPARKNG